MQNLLCSRVQCVIVSVSERNISICFPAGTESEDHLPPFCTVGMKILPAATLAKH